MRLSKLTIQLHDSILFRCSTTFHNILPNEMDKVTFSNGRCDSKQDSNWRNPWWNPFKANHQSLDNSAVSSLWGGFEVDSKLGSSRIHIIARWTEKACNSHCFKWTMTKKVMVIHQVTACLQKVAFYKTRGETANECKWSMFSFNAWVKKIGNPKNGYSIISAGSGHSLVRDEFSVMNETAGVLKTCNCKMPIESGWVASQCMSSGRIS